MRTKVYIVLVNFNGQADTQECIASVLKSSFTDYQIVVVDNSTSPASLDSLVSWGKQSASDFTILHEHELATAAQPQQQIIFIKAAENRGFAAANNLALRWIARFDDCEYAWLLNNDTTIESDTLAALVQCAGTDARTGIWGSKLLMYYSPGILQGVGGLYNRWFGLVREIGAGESDQGQWDSIRFHQDYVIGASMFVARGFLDEVGLMEEDYFLYYEELDWSLRGRRKGWRLGYCGASKVYHKMGASINGPIKQGNSKLADFYSARNRILVTKRFFPYALFTLYPSFLKFVLNRILLKQFSRIGMLFRIMLRPRKHYVFKAR